MTLNEFLSRLNGVKRYNGYYMAMCPVHNTKDSSMKVCSGNDGRILIDCKYGCETSDILDRMRLTFADLFPDQHSITAASRDFKKIEQPPKKQPKQWQQRGKIVASYEYRDDSGRLLAVKDRYEPKFMSWRHPDGNGGWLNGTGGSQLPLYKHECIGNPVYIVEGEKDVDTLRDGGLHAVTNPNGASEWKDRYTEQLRGFDVAVIPDNDEPGRKHAHEVCTALHGVARSVKLLDLSELWGEMPEHGDVTDYVQQSLKAGQKKERVFRLLEALRENLSEFVPSEDSQPEPQFDLSKYPVQCVADIDFQKTPRVKFYVDDILTEGLYFLTAFSKVGKSRMTMQMLLAICNGAQFLGKNTTQAAVLYCALEDERIDFENRMNKFLQGSPQPRNFYYYTKEAFDLDTPTLDDNSYLIPLLESVLKEHPNVKVVAIDVFNRIRSEKKPGADFTAHEQKDLNKLLKLTAKYGLSLIIAHHVSKGGLRADRQSSIGSGAGSYVISGTVHGELEIALDKDDEKRAKFSYKGRRIRSGHLAVRDEYPFWKLEGDWEAVTFADDPTVATIKYLVREFGQWRGTAKQLVEANRKNENLPPIIKKPNKKTIEKFARQLQSVGIRYIQHPNGSGGVTHEFVRADAEDNSGFTEIQGAENLEWEDIVNENEAVL